MSYYYDSIPCYMQQGFDQTIPAFHRPAAGAGPQMPLFPLPVISPTGYPTGMPVGPTTAPLPMPTAAPSAPSPAPSETAFMPQALQNPAYTAGFLRTQIGRRMRVDFLIGTNTLTDRSGILVGVGASYILLRIEETNEIIMCDLYSIKFVTIFPQAAPMGATVPLGRE